MNCLGCKERHPHCHSSCEVYKAFKAECDREREERFKNYICFNPEKGKPRKRYRYYANRDED